MNEQRVGWVLYDGDEYHGFIYSRPSDDGIIGEDYLPVFVKTDDDEEPIYRTARTGRPS